jgi:hypothetical protein
MEAAFQKLLDEYNGITAQMASGNFGSVSAGGGSPLGGDIAKLGKRQAELAPVVGKIEALKATGEEL